jgi:hypothetical protein
VWTPFLNMQALPAFGVKIHESVGSSSAGASARLSEK